jgi:hypothetical protein
MRGRYRRTTAEEEIARRFNIPIPPQLDLPISYNIAPTQNVLAIRRNPETGERTLDALRGLVPNWAKDEKIGYKTINARVETVDTATSCPAGIQETPVPDSSGWILRMAQSVGRKDSVQYPDEGRSPVRVRGALGRLETAGKRGMDSYLHDNNGRAE